MKLRQLMTFALLVSSARSAETPMITVEAESFVKQTLDSKRKWEIKKERPDSKGSGYIEVLPDTRVTHNDKMVGNENFSDEPGEVAVLHYTIQVPEPGRYYVWARTFSTGSEDNGLHFGLDGQWPESGQRWQTVEKDAWHWDCKQRTANEHSGVPMQLWLDVDKAGEHTLMLSMREDGAEVDQIILAKSPDFRPEGVTYTATADEKAKRKANLARQPDGKAGITVSGDLKQWHKVTLTLDGPFAAEHDNEPNPFTDLAFNVTFTHESGSPKYTIPGYFAADGNAGESSVEFGTKWRANLSPDKPGTWTYTTSFTQGKNAALDGGGEPIKTYHGKTGSFKILPTDKKGRDFRGQGRLTYVGKHHLQFAGSKQYFLKAGPDSPENLLGYADFDGTESGKKGNSLKRWQPHVKDWQAGDPTWKDGKGKGIIGALNYLTAKGCNSFSFLTYNAGGDGDDVWPFTERDAKFHYDCSKLDQWGMVFDYATNHGIYCHFKLQETENDDNRGGDKKKEKMIETSLDGGELGPERKLYLREIVARFGHLLALNWNLGEENTQSSDEQRAMLDYIAKVDAYQHVRVLHTYPGQQKKVYTPLLGDQSALMGVSLQTKFDDAHEETLDWVVKSDEAKKPWVVAHDEQGPAGLGAPPDPGYEGFNGTAHEKKQDGGSEAEGHVKADGYTIDDIRKATLWGNLMAGGAGVEYYFGYKLPQNDTQCQDYRSRDKSWDYCRIAIDFFQENKIPFYEMKNANALIGNDKNDNSKFCLAKSGELYLVYLPKGGNTEVDLSGITGEFKVSWFNPREGGSLKDSGKPVTGGSKVQLDAPDTQDWLAVVTKK